jgi:hypothetical protein
VTVLASSVVFRYDSRLSNSVPRAKKFFTAMWSWPCIREAREVDFVILVKFL